MKLSKLLGYLQAAASGCSSLIKITLAFIAVAVLTVFSLRIQGFSRHYSALDHPLLQIPFVVAAQSTRDLPPNTQLSFDQIQSLSPEIWLFVDIQECADSLIVYQDERLEKMTEAQGWVRETPLAELEAFNASYHFAPEQGYPYRARPQKILSLDQVLQTYPKARFILNIHSNLRDIHKHASRVINRHQANRRVLIQSDHDVILSALKELEPFWVFGTGMRDLTRSHLLNSIFLEPLAPMAGDVVIASVKSHGHEILSSRLINEIHRRHKKAFALGVNDPETLSKMQTLGVDGVVTEKPEQVWPQIHP